MKDILVNRDLSWLLFNERVLEESRANTPLLQRMKFLAIFSSNLDEFFMVRVGEHMQTARQKPKSRDGKSRLTIRELLQQIYKKSRSLCQRRDKYFHNLSEQLRDQAGLVHARMKKLSDSEMKFVSDYFNAELRPMLIPQIVDNRHPFPNLANSDLYIALDLKKGAGVCLGLIPVPKSFDRILRLPSKKKNRFVLLEEVIEHFAHKVFRNCTVEERCIFAVTRSAELDTDEEIKDSEVDYRRMMKGALNKRERLGPVRLQMSRQSPHLRWHLLKHLGLRPRQIFVQSSPLDLSYIYNLERLLDPETRARMTLPDFVPTVTFAGDMMSRLRAGDMLLSYPYESMQPFLSLLRQASLDPHVTSIFITLYRVAKNSRVVRYLMQACESGQEVTVLTELRARFDEENNINIANQLESAGCRIIYGEAGLKVHSKACQITRKVDDTVTRYTYIGTGNFNERTATIYGDYALLTTDPVIGDDVNTFFQNILVGNHDEGYQRLIVAPRTLLSTLHDHIDQQIALGEQGYILLKCNALTHTPTIRRLVAASQAGVRVDLVVRSACCLLPGVPGMTDNIRVVSIVGQFLEHARVYAFGRDCQTVYICSGDLMTRNLERRVEVGVPICDPELAARIISDVRLQLADDTQARELDSDGVYAQRRGGTLNAQAMRAGIKS